MSLAEALEKEKGRQGCQVCKWLAELPQKDQECFAEWLESGRAMAPLHRASKKQNPPVPVERCAFERHCRDCR